MCAAQRDNEFAFKVTFYNSSKTCLNSSIIQALLACPLTSLECRDGFGKTLTDIASERGQDDLVTALTEERLRRFTETRLRKADSLDAANATPQELRAKIRKLGEELEAHAKVKRSLGALRAALDGKRWEADKIADEMLSLKEDVSGN